MRIKPDYAPAHFNLGNALGKEGDLDGATKEFREALRINPKDAEAHNSLGETFRCER